MSPMTIYLAALNNWQLPRQEAAKPKAERLPGGCLLYRLPGAGSVKRHREDQPDA